MAAPRFVLGSDSLQFSKGLRFPLSKPIEMTQAIDRDAGGGLQVEDLGVTIKRRSLRFTQLPQADYDLLVNWYLNIARGALNSFSYFDEDGIEMEVRLLSTPFDFQEVSNGRFAGELLLEVVG
jgi:hypothetical protein